MPSKKDKPNPSDAEIVTSRYRGPDRRGENADEEPEELFSKKIRYDEKGNPVWEIRVTAPRRREDDETVSLLKCLEDESLTLVDDEEED